MEIKATFSVELGGHIYSKGEILKGFVGVVTQRIADNFRYADGTPLKVGETIGARAVPTAKEEGGKESPQTSEAQPSTEVVGDEEKIAKTVEVMKRDGIKLALEQMGITYPPKAKTEYLAKLLLMGKGEITEG